MSCSSSSASEEEDESMDSYRKGGYHAVRIAGGRYIAQRKLGWGQFSTVWLAYDSQTSKYVALKIQKSAPEFAQSAIHEIEVVSALTKNDPENKKCVIRLVDHFKHSGPNGQHFCMVFEFLGDIILQLIKYYRYKGLPLNKVRNIYRCILTALYYLHKQVARISARRVSLGGVRPVTKGEMCLYGIDFRCKVVDFGNACWLIDQMQMKFKQDNIELLKLYYSRDTLIQLTCGRLLALPLSLLLARRCLLPKQDKVSVKMREGISRSTYWGSQSQCC